MPRERADAATQMRQRVEVLALDALIPRPNNSEIARLTSQRVGRPVNVSTVRYILKRFRNAGTVLPEDNQRTGRPNVCTPRLKRYN